MSVRAGQAHGLVHVLNLFSLPHHHLRPPVRWYLKENRGGGASEAKENSRRDRTERTEEKKREREITLK